MRTTYVIQHACKFRLYPNKTQKKWIDKNLVNTYKFHNYLLNSIYEDTTEVNEETGEEYNTTIIHWDIVNNGLNLLQFKFYNKHPETLANIYDQVRRDVKRNFSTFYTDGKGKPKFKSGTGRLSFRLPQNNRDLFLIRRNDELNHGTPYDFEINQLHAKTSSKLSHNLGWLHIPGCGATNDYSNDYIKCFCPCNIEKESISSVTISRNPDGKYYASIVLRNGRVYISKKNALDAMDAEKKVGIDINLSPKTRVVASSPYFSSEPFGFDVHTEVKQARSPYKEYFPKLRKEQRSLSRKVSYSKRWFKQKRKLAKVHQKIANIRLDWNRRMAAYLTTHYNEIAIEDLRISQMKWKQPRWFQKLYNDANLYQLIQAIKWSCLKAGRKLFYVTPEHTSKTCNECGFTNHDLKLGQRRWCCPNCGTILNRDENAARNIYDLVFDWHFDDSELSSNRIFYEPFSERMPVTNELFVKNLKNHCGGEEVVTITATA